MLRLLLVCLCITKAGALCAQSHADSVRIANNPDVSDVQTGIASYYHSKFQGRPTASGEPYDEHLLTAAHNRLPLNTMIRVTNLRNKRSVVVRVNDRLNHRNKRLVDLSKAAAIKLGYVGRGLTKVRVEVLKD